MRFRLIDRVISFENGDNPRLVTAKAFPHCDEFTLGYPQRPGEVPTCLILESLAASGVRLVYACTDGAVVGLLLKVEVAQILAPLLAGEELVVETELLGLQAEARQGVGVAQTRGRASAGDRLVAEARMVLLCFPKDGFETSLPW